MNTQAVRWLAILTLFLPAYAGSANEAALTLNGEFAWDAYERGKLKAVFTPAGDERWDVAFHFHWSGQPRVFSGTAEGSLTEGKLEGEVRTENKRRTWVFRGSFEDGRFRGSHAEVSSRGRERDTGSLTLKR